MRKLMGKQFRYTAVFIALLISMTGCGEKKKVVEDDYGKVETATPGEADINDGADIDDVVEWKEDYIIDGNALSIDVSAENYTKKNIVIYRYNKRYLDADSKKAILEKLTEKGIYRLDDESVPKSVWEARLEDQKRALGIEGELSDDDPNAEYIRQLEEEIAAAPDDFIIETEFSNDLYYIDYKDMLYVVFICSVDPDNEARNNTMYYMKPEGNYDYWLPESLNEKKNSICEGAGNLKYGDVENECKLSEAELENICQEFLDKQDIEGFKVAGINNLVWYANGENIGFYGYEVIYLREFDNLLVYDSMIESKELVENGDDSYEILMGYGTEAISFYVCDKGIISLDYRSLTQKPEKTEDNTVLLDFEKVKSVVIDWFTKTNKEKSGVDLKYDKLQFCYVNVYNPANSDEVSSVPVWYFMDSSMTNDPLVINAIDGEVLETLCDEYHVLEWGW